MLTKSNPFELMVSDHHGIYVPQIFAETVRRDLFGETISAEDYAILESGPDHEHYWDAWDSVLNSAETEDGVSLHQDGDLWAVNWSLIGDPEEIAEIGAMALDLFNSCDQRRGLLGELWASLMDGPSFGRWTDDMLSTLRNMVESVSNRISADLPRYWHSDFGIEELDVDVMALLIAESPALTAISKYW